MTVSFTYRTLALAALGLVSMAALLGLGRQPGFGTPGPPVPGMAEHGVLTFGGLDATFLTSDAKARRWQEIIKASGQPVVEEYNRMSILDTLVNGGWDIVEYEFVIDAAGNDIERYLLKRAR